MSESLIHILDENTANQIAAGEVVERPASIVKELVENAIDAKSSVIEVEIADGGTSYIRVTDNGIGMSYQDAAVAILRHATSKIRAADDLARICTLGFRGEALPTIAAVAKLSLTTRLHAQTFATYVEVYGGTVTDIREAGGNVGTSVIVTELFYNTPARKKFLKTASSESSHIHDVLVKLALSHPDISFKLINNSRMVLSTPGTNQLDETLVSLYGNKIRPELLPIEFEEEDLSITGYLSKPTLLKSSRHWQTFIINSRVINSRFIAKAIDNAYHSLLPKSGYPLVVLNLTVPIHTIDVNVHPQKSEIKFSDEGKIFKFIYKTVINTLQMPLEPKQIAATIQPDIKTLSTNFNSKQQLSYFPEQEIQQFPQWRENPLPFSSAVPIIKNDEQRMVLPEIIREYSIPEENIGQSAETFELNALGQFADCYIIAQNNEGLYLIDQHAAHERILYDKLSKNTERIPSQQLLVPVYLELDEKECLILNENSTILYELGFTVDLIGPNTMRIVELPVDIPTAEAEVIIREILESLQNMHSPSSQELRHSVLQIASCRAAIKAGDSLNMRQIQALINELCATKLPYTCPHGRPAIIRFDAKDLAKMFKRT